MRVKLRMRDQESLGSTPGSGVVSRPLAGKIGPASRRTTHAGRARSPETARFQLNLTHMPEAAATQDALQRTRCNGREATARLSTDGQAFNRPWPGFQNAGFPKLRFLDLPVDRTARAKFCVEILLPAVRWCVFFPSLRAVSSVVEHCLDTAGVTGSNPVSRTSFPDPLFARGTA